ncbi:hypothetical protein [Candidatus Nitrospira bockiana]
MNPFSFCLHAVLVGVVLLHGAALPSPGHAAGGQEISGALPRTEAGAVDIVALREAVAARIAEGAREVHVRDFSLSPAEARALLLAVDRSDNLLRQLADGIPQDGVERQVALRGSVDGQRVDARVQRQEDGALPCESTVCA